MSAPLLGSLVALENAGFVLGSYAVTFAVIGALAWRAVRGGRRLAEQVDDEHKYWS